MTDRERREVWPWLCMWGALAVVGVALLAYWTGDTVSWVWPLVLLALALGLVGLGGMVWQTRKRR